MSDLENRVTELEEKIAFQEDTIQKLDDALISQQQQIMDLEHKLSLLMSQVQKLEDVRATPPEDEKPPHY